MKRVILLFAGASAAVCVAAAQGQTISQPAGCAAGISCQASTVAIGGASLGGANLAVSGSSTFTGSVQVASGNLRLGTDAGTLTVGAANDVILSRKGAAILQHGDADTAAPVAQTITGQSVSAGTSNAAGPNFTIAAPKGTGTGAGGAIVFQVAPPGSAGSSQNALATALTIDSTKTATSAGNIITVAGSLFVLNNIGSLFLGTASDVSLSRSAPATLQHGGLDAAAPVAQTVTAQSVVAGTANTAAPNFTIVAPKGTGTGAGGSLVFQVAPAGATSSAQNALATALTIDSSKTATFASAVNASTFDGCAGACGRSMTRVGSFSNDTTAGIDMTASNAAGPFTIHTGGTGAGALALTIGVDKSVTLGTGPIFNASGNLNMASGAVQNLGATAGLAFAGRSAISSPADGIVQLTNNAQTGFTALNFGPNTTSFPRLAVSGNGFIVQTGDGATTSGLTVGAFVANVVRTNPTNVGSLTACNAGSDGSRQFVTDATTTTFASAVTGGGANHVPVYCDGSGTPTWKIG